jgi:hypothetical protein
MFTLTIDTAKDAFGESFDETAAELSRILATVRQALLAGRSAGPIMDINGNTVGRYDLTPSR